jgi:hypothetical protein
VKGRPDVEVLTRVRAKALHFGRVPETKVGFEGEPAEESTSLVERRNLPDEVEPGVTYRDVEVRWSAGARIVHPADAERDASDEERREQAG